MAACRNGPRSGERGAASRIWNHLGRPGPQAQPKAPGPVPKVPGQPQKFRDRPQQPPHSTQTGSPGWIRIPHVTALRPQKNYKKPNVFIISRPWPIKNTRLFNALSVGPIENQMFLIVQTHKSPKTQGFLMFLMPLCCHGWPVTRAGMAVLRPKTSRKP